MALRRGLEIGVPPSKIPPANRGRRLRRRHLSRSRFTTATPAKSGIHLHPPPLVVRMKTPPGAVNSAATWWKGIPMCVRVLRFKKDVARLIPDACQCVGLVCYSSKRRSTRSTVVQYASTIFKSVVLFCVKYIVTSPVEHLQYSSWRLQVDCESSVAYVVHEGTLPDGVCGGCRCYPLPQPASETRDGVVPRKAHAFLCEGLMQIFTLHWVLFLRKPRWRFHHWIAAAPRLLSSILTTSNKTEFGGETKVVTDYTIPIAPKHNTIHFKHKGENPELLCQGDSSFRTCCGQNALVPIPQGHVVRFVLQVRIVHDW